MALALKLDKLNKHETAKKTGNLNNNNILDKREYCKIASEVSMEFENLSKKYEKDLSSS